MSKQSKALLKFRKTIHRCRVLIGTYAELVRGFREAFPNKQPLVVFSDIVRACLVLSVAAMDTYFTAVFVEMLVPHLKKREPTERMVRILSKAGLDTRQAVIMLGMSRPYRRLRFLVEGYLERYVTQRFRAIDELFLAYGLKDFSRQVERKLKRRTLLRRIEKLVERRNDIVHEGDYDSRGRLRKIGVSDTLKRIRDLQRFVEAAEQILRGHP